MIGDARELGRTRSGHAVHAYRLRTERLEAVVLSLGGRLASLRVRDVAGAWRDVVLGLDSLADWQADPSCIGGLVGPYANRIRRARYAREGRPVELDANEGVHQLHGGAAGFHRKVWEVERGSERGAPALRLRHRSPDGAGGFPGNLDCEVYLALEDGGLVLIQEARCDAVRPVSLSHHPYWNLEGHDAGPIDGHVLSVEASRLLEVDGDKIPTGRLLDVAAAGLDLRAGHEIGSRRLDHCYSLADQRGDAPVPVARLHAPGSGLTLVLETNEVGLQVYTGDGLPRVRGKHRAHYGPRSGLCLESEGLPDAPNHAAFPAPWLRPGDVYRQVTRYRFEAGL